MKKVSFDVYKYGIVVWWHGDISVPANHINKIIKTAIRPHHRTSVVSKKLTEFYGAMTVVAIGPAAMEEWENEVIKGEE
jgi:hypothetical protein